MKGQESGIKVFSTFKRGKKFERVAAVARFGASDETSECRERPSQAIRSRSY